MELMSARGAVVVRVYYDATISPTLPQPLINGPRGLCLDITNTSGKTRRVEYTPPGGTLQSVSVPQGDPVNSRSMTVAQMNNLGFFLRSDLVGFTLS
jgi:uncharacterized protein RhaS with RHS repeats